MATSRVLRILTGLSCPCLKTIGHVARVLVGWQPLTTEGCPTCRWLAICPEQPTLWRLTAQEQDPPLPGPVLWMSQPHLQTNNHCFLLGKMGLGWAWPLLWLWGKRWEGGGRGCWTWPWVTDSEALPVAPRGQSCCPGGAWVTLCPAGLPFSTSPPTFTRMEQMSPAVFLCFCFTGVCLIYFVAKNLSTVMLYYY